MSTITRRSALGLLAAGAIAPLAMPGIARAQSGQVIRIVYPYAGGSAVNNIIRMIGDHMSRTLEQPVVVEDRPGGNGIVATQAVASAAPDGTMVLVGATGTLSLNSLLRPALPYKLEDFRPVGMMLDGPLTVTINSKLPASDIKSLVEWAKAENKPLRYGMLGPGSVTHLFGVLVGKATGVETVPVAYRNNNAQILDLLGGQNELNLSTPASLIEHERAGTLKMLAVTTPERMAKLPDTPTVAEAGYPSLLCSFWNSLMVPKATPDDIVGRLNAALNAATEDAEIRERMENECLVAMSGEPDAVAATIDRDLATWGDVIRSEGISLE